MSRTRVGEVLALVQRFVGEAESDGSRLVVVTRGDMTLEPDPATAGVWVWCGSAQAEYPGRIVIADVGSHDDVALAVASGEPQVGGVRRPAVRAAAVAVTSEASEPQGWDPEGTVLITGAGGALGTLLARHLVTEYGVRHLLLLSRRGRVGSEELADELEALGAAVTFATCDVADRESLSAALAEVPAEHPLTAVLHAAGVLDDGVVTALTPERVRRGSCGRRSTVPGCWTS
ncbi:hypothetical protein GCM10020221_32290 [Streptomyces thioluteus]|uniref:Ketoreductase domain-containing protein n=1 Tax=Streptomyces thioluteus TaxID=66431 RepID=A0ABP6JI27_STRTU